jgi:enoyl-CoA hydratase/carnithine racemase
MSFEIERNVSGDVETWWLNRPEVHNAVSLDMWHKIVVECERLEGDRSLRVLVVRGRGEHFSAGADVNGLGRALAADVDGSVYRATNAAAEAALSALPLVTIALINGYCVGGAVQLALACDIRIASEDAQFGVTPARLGIVYPALATARLVATIGRTAAADLLLRGHLIDAQRALDIGLVSNVSTKPEETLDAYVDEVLSRSSSSQIATKQVMNELLRNETLSALGTELEQASLQHGDLDEGLAAFREHRKPQFGPRP